jgi:uncharacterized protein (TIGR00269 family)
VAVKTPPCSICGRPSVAYVKASKMHLCENHFIEYFERRVARLLRRVRLKRSAKLLLALSGGKDSSALAEVLARLKDDFSYEILGVHIDLGIGSYSKASRAAAEEEARKIGVPLLLIDLREVLGAGIPELARLSRRPPCSVCGLVKRYVLNAAAIEWEADYVVTGHNGDDIIAYALKAFINQDLESISKLGPVTDTIRGLAVGRLRPLYMFTEKETFIYALLRRAKFTLEECPNLNRRQMEVRLKVWVSRVEDDMPGVKQQLLGNLSRRYTDYPRPKGSLERCPVCGLISSGGECSFCRLTRKALGEPMGPRVRAYIRERLGELGLGGEGRL